MIFRKAKPLSFAAALAVAVLTACNSSPTSPQATTSPEARADLQDMAAKVKYFAPQSPNAGNPNGGFAKRGATQSVLRKASADTTPGTSCDLEATLYESWNTDTSATGDVTVQYDTITSYTAAGQPICAYDDSIAYQLTDTRSENAMLETHVRTRTETPANFLTGEFKMTGSGTVDYKDGYLITITSMNIVIDFGKGVMTTYVMNLALEKGYTVVLQPGPGISLMDDQKPDANAVQVSGPIVKDGAVVGYFEVMGDDRVIIRDAAKAIIESHG